MPRKSKYNYYYPQRSKAAGKRNKYSTMTYVLVNGNPKDPEYKPYFTVVPPADVEGMRKVKNISIQLAYDGTRTGATDSDQAIVWAIVYVPKGSEPGTVGVNAGVLYSPPQFIMASGIYDTKNPGNTSRIFTPLSRNLNAGDGIAFVYTPKNPLIENQLMAVINYAITLQ